MREPSSNYSTVGRGTWIVDGRSVGFPVVATVSSRPEMDSLIGDAAIDGLGNVEVPKLEAKA